MFDSLIFAETFMNEADLGTSISVMGYLLRTEGFEPWPR